MRSIQLIAVILMFALTANAQQPVLNSEHSCVRSDTLDPLPDWSYCEIIAQLDTSLQFLVPRDWTHWTETFEKPSVFLTLDSMRLLAWCVRETISDHRKHGMDIRKYYQDLALIWVWFRYEDTSQTQAALIVMKRDTNAFSMDQSWRTHFEVERISHRSVDGTLLGDIIPHQSIHFFSLPLSDGNALDTAARGYLSILFRGDSLMFNGEVRNVLQRGAIRHETWQRCLGSDPPLYVRVD